MKKCLKCGFENEETETYCKQCGSMLDGTNDVESSEKVRNYRSEKLKIMLLSSQMLMILITSLIISICAVVFFVFQMKMFEFNKSIYAADLLLLIFFSVVGLLALSLLVVRTVLKIKDRKR